MMIRDVKYSVARIGAPPMRVVGMRVGRFALRMRSAGNVLATADDGVTARPQRDFVIDHLRSGIQIADFSQFVDALRVADDASRFAATDVNTCHKRELFAQLGHEMIEWLRDCVEVDRAIAYRDWLTTRSGYEAQR